MKNILIFGASKNLGLYLSKSISKKYNVYNFSRTQLNKNSFKVDIRDINSLNLVLKKLKKKLKKIDSIIFCIGKSTKNYKKIASSENFEEAFGYNFYSFVNLLNSYLKIFNKKPVKFIIISSIAGLKDIKAPTTYMIAKNALSVYSKLMARRLIKFKININLISPGNIFMNNNNWGKKLKSNKNKTLKYIRDNVPSNKFVEPKEILKIINLIIDNNLNLVGSDIVIDGGQIL